MCYYLCNISTHTVSKNSTYPILSGNNFKNSIKCSSTYKDNRTAKITQIYNIILLIYRIDDVE